MSTLLAAMYITNFGRKTMYFLSTTLTIAFQIAFGFIDFFNIGTSFKMVPILLICCQVFFLQLGLQTFPNLLSSELFPNDARSRCKGFIRAFSAISSAVMLKLFPYAETYIGKETTNKNILNLHSLKEMFNKPVTLIWLSHLLFQDYIIVFFPGLYGTFWMLSSILLLIIPFIYLYVPEAKDVDLADIDQFFSPVKTQFYMQFPLTESNIPCHSSSSHRIQMIQNMFGTAGRMLNDGSRVLLAEGFLMKRSKDQCKKRHFFLFSDMLVWGSIIKENINYIRQRIIHLHKMEIENIKHSNSWKLITSGISINQSQIIIKLRKTVQNQI